MLTRLSIRDIVLIDRLDIDCAPGLSVLTGETGAGKSILLDAFALALGARGDATLVRQGAEQGQVAASFELATHHPARALLPECDIPADEPLILRRVQFADGRTRAFINDQPVSVQALQALGAALVEIHGQHDARALVDAATHRRLLDAYGGLDEQALVVAGLWEARRDAGAAVASHRAEVERAAREADWLRHAVEELGKLKPQAGEETSLAERRAAMMQAEKIAGDLRDAHDAVAGAASPVPTLAAAVRRLERRGTQAPALVEPAVKALDAALHSLEEARGHLEHALGVADHDPAELERIEERLFALRAAGRKYNSPVDALSALAEKYAADLALIDAGAERLAALESNAREAGEQYAKTAATLSAARRKAIDKLDKAVNGELKPLKLERAKFSTQVESDPADAGPNGIDRVEFWVQTNPGTRPGPLVKVASGGELARFMLALKVVLADRGSAPTLVFDEIDTGVGGAVADAIGVRLARLGGRVQVLIVTHAPQVAARAERHYLITKEALDKGKRVATRVTELAAARRREEIARMLAGAEITEEARAAAEKLNSRGRVVAMPQISPLDIAVVGWHSHNQMFDEIGADLQRAGHRIVRHADRAAFGSAHEPLADADLLLCVAVFPIDRAMIEGAQRLRAIVSAVTGVEGVDIAAATECGVVVANAQTGENVIGMAEATLLLMLAALYDLDGAQERVRQKLWRPPQLKASQVRGKTVGFVGLGKIGRETARLLAPFGADLQYSARRDAELAGLPAMTRVDLATLLRTSDVVLVLASLNAETRGMIGAEQLRLMKKSAILVNTARGAIVDEAALAAALRDGTIAGAALDCFTVEPLPADSPLRGLPNVILTPHMIGHTVEAHHSLDVATRQNLDLIAAGQPPRYVVNPAVLPAWRKKWVNSKPVA